MDQTLRDYVRQRAGNVCEYCRLPQSSSRFIRFHMEHIIARQHRGLSVANNLALACGYCNHHKGPNIAGLDPETGKLVPLYDPRCDQWSEHFAWNDVVLVGLTPVGRTTIELLAINDWQRLELRDNLRALGEAFAG
jgi:hypothetical protein